MKERLLLPELMDNPAIDPLEHQRALAGLRRINWVCRAGTHLTSEIESIAITRQMNSFSVLDIGCGSGDIVISVTKSLSSRFECHSEGWDISETACQTASHSAQHHVWPVTSSSVCFREVDIFNPPEVQFDFVYCCLFLHHFSNEAAIQVMSQMKQLAKVAVIVDDLRRTSLGLLMAKIGCYGLSRSPVVHYDGPQSVRAAFSQAEVLRLATEAGLDNAKIRRHWPQRYLLTWQHS